MANNMFLKIDGIEGESLDSDHSKWIEITRFDHQVSLPITNVSGSGGKTQASANFEVLKVEKEIDMSTVELHMACATGKHIEKIELEITQVINEKKHTYLKYIIEHATVQSISIAGQTEERPTEEVTFVFGKINWIYKAVGDMGAETGTVDRTWSVEENKKV